MIHIRRRRRPCSTPTPSSPPVASENPNQPRIMPLLVAARHTLNPHCVVASSPPDHHQSQHSHHRYLLQQHHHQAQQQYLNHHQQKGSSSSHFFGNGSNISGISNGSIIPPDSPLDFTMSKFKSSAAALFPGYLHNDDKGERSIGNLRMPFITSVDQKKLID